MDKFSYMKYTFDPENKMLTWKLCTENEENRLPKFGQVVHASGKKYFVALPGNINYQNTPKKEEIAYKLFKTFYAEKLDKAAKELNNAANALSFFYAATIGDSDGA